MGCGPEGHVQCRTSFGTARGNLTSADRHRMLNGWESALWNDMLLATLDLVYMESETMGASILEYISWLYSTATERHGK